MSTVRSPTICTRPAGRTAIASRRSGDQATGPRIGPIASPRAVGRSVAGSSGITRPESTPNSAPTKAATSITRHYTAPAQRSSQTVVPSRE